MKMEKGRGGLRLLEGYMRGGGKVVFSFSRGGIWGGFVESLEEVGTLGWQSFIFCGRGREEDKVLEDRRCRDISLNVAM